MDSSGPWASYTYNGLPPSQAPPPGSLGSSSAGQRTVADLQAMGNNASQLLLAGMSPAAVAVAANSSFQLGNYDSTVFSSLFHHQKQQHRSHQVVGQGGQMEQSSPWTPQTNSLGNPFGVLPHQASQKNNASPSKGENTFSAHLIPPFAHSASSYGNAGSVGAPNLPFIPQKTAPKVPIFTPKAPPKHKAPPLEPRYNPAPPSGISAAAAVAAASAVINNTKPSNIIVHRSFPPHLQPQCRSYPSPDSDYQQHRNTPDSVSSGPYGDSDCHMSMERPSPNPSSPYYNMASPDSCVYSKPSQHERQQQPPQQQQQQQQQQPPPIPPQQQFPMKPHNSWDEKRTVGPPGRYNYSESENNNAFHVSDQQHYHSTINLSDLHGGGEELLAHGGSDSEDYERSNRKRRNKRARKSDSPEKINRQLTLLQPVHAEDGYAATLGFHSRVAFPPLPNQPPGAPGHQQHPQHQQHAHHQAQQEQQHQQQNNYHPQEQHQSKSLIDEELGFLESMASKKGGGPSKPSIQLKKDQPAFMDSYIKFLSGDQDNSLCSTSVRSGRKSPPRQRGRTIPQNQKAVCQEAAPQLQPPPQPTHHQQQQQQHLQQQHHHGYQIHQQQQLDPASHREDAVEHGGRGRKRSLPQEGQNEGMSIAGFEEQELLENCVDTDAEIVPEVAEYSSDEEIDFTEDKFQPKVVIARISPRTIRQYSQSDDDESNSVDESLNVEEPADQTQPEPRDATELSMSSNVTPVLHSSDVEVGKSKETENVTKEELHPTVSFSCEEALSNVLLAKPTSCSVDSLAPQVQQTMQKILSQMETTPVIVKVGHNKSTDADAPAVSFERIVFSDLEEFMHGKRGRLHEKVATEHVSPGKTKCNVTRQTAEDGQKKIVKFVDGVDPLEMDLNAIHNPEGDDSKVTSEHASNAKTECNVTQVVADAKSKIVETDTVDEVYPIKRVINDLLNPESIDPKTTTKHVSTRKTECKLTQCVQVAKKKTVDAANEVDPIAIKLSKLMYPEGDNDSKVKTGPSSTRKTDGNVTQVVEDSENEIAETVNEVDPLDQAVDEILNPREVDSSENDEHITYIGGRGTHLDLSDAPPVEVTNESFYLSGAAISGVSNIEDPSSQPLKIEMIPSHGSKLNVGFSMADKLNACEAKTSATEIESCKGAAKFNTRKVQPAPLEVDTTEINALEEVMDIMEWKEISIRKIPDSEISESEESVKDDKMKRRSSSKPAPASKKVHLKAAVKDDSSAMPAPHVATTIDDEMEPLLGPDVIKQSKQSSRGDAGSRNKAMHPEAAFLKAFLPASKPVLSNVRKTTIKIVKRRLPGMSGGVPKPDLCNADSKRFKPANPVEIKVPPKVVEVEECDLEPELPPNARRRKYKTGTFMFHVSEKPKGQHHRLYRVDGPEMKQVYEPCVLNRELLYKSTPSYSSWCLAQYREFKVVEVEFYKKTPNMNIVRMLLPDSPKKTPQGAKTKSVCATEENEDTFRTYIQALLSQVVDNGFLQVVFEQDVAFFVKSILEIDSLNDDRKVKMQKFYNLPSHIIDMLDRWPQFVPLELNACNKCQCCKTENALYLLEARGNAYCKQTLIPLELDLSGSEEREFIACRGCCLNVLKYCRIAHLKINCYQLCHNEMEKIKPESRIGNILDIVHSDWFDTLFKSLQEMWAMVDCIDSKIEP